MRRPDRTYTRESRPFIAVAGNDGVGKSTVVATIADKFSLDAFREDADGNPYLESAFVDPAMTHRSQEFFLESALRSQHVLSRLGGGVQERTIYENFEVFVRFYRGRGLLSADAFENLSSKYTSMLREAPRTPDVLIYLTAPVDVLVDRIRSREGCGDSHVDKPYLLELEGCYVRFLASWDLCPVVTVATGEPHLSPAEVAARAVALAVEVLDQRLR